MEQTGVLVVRVWIEDGSERRLRARLTRTLDVATGDRCVDATDSAAGVLELVEEWLEAFDSLAPVRDAPVTFR